MVNTNNIFLAFKKKLDSMTLEERNSYIKQMGIKFRISPNKSARPYQLSKRRQHLQLTGRSRVRLAKKQNKVV